MLITLIVVREISTTWKTIVAQTVEHSYSNIKHDGHIVMDTKSEKLIFLLRINFGYSLSADNQLPQLHPISP